jgi:GT2 family glycosyltransferase
LADTARRCEIFVVDNGSTDRTVAVLNGMAIDDPFSMHLIQLAENHGTTVSRNMALKKATGDYICVMDSDVEVRGAVFIDLAALLQSDATIGLAVPKIYYPSGKWQKSHDCFPTVLHKIKRILFLRSMEASEGSEELQSNNLKDVDYAISAFWLFRRSLLEEVGLLDEKIFYAPEDVDFCLRIWKAGLRIVYQPSESIIHHTQEISRGWKLNKAKIEHLKGLVYYFIKHKYLVKKPTC